MTTTASDIEILEELNRGYIRAAETSDVGWYTEHLTEDFLTDIYARRDGRWLCVAAHFTRF